MSVIQDFEEGTDDTQKYVITRKFLLNFYGF